jgi:hypothetical protein
MVSREATLYRETGDRPKSGAITLTRMSDVRPPDDTLRHKKIDVIAGHFWVANLPDLTKRNEAYLEVTLVTIKGDIRVPHAFKLMVKVKDKTFSSDIQGVEMITGAEVIGTGIEFQTRLTELDQIDRDKFKAIKDFIENNDIPGVSEALLKLTAPINGKEAVKIFFNAVDLVDKLNDDDRVWIERPKLDLRQAVDNPLYKGWYAFVTTPRVRGKPKPTDLPRNLFLSGGRLYSAYTSHEENTSFEDETYLTWQILES